MNKVKVLIEMYGLKSGPAYLPYSLGLLGVLACLDLILGGALLSPNHLALACLVRLMHLVLWAAFINAILRWRKLSERFVQTYTAVLGLEVITVMLVLIGVLLKLSPYVSIILIIWNFAAVSNVLRQAFNVKPWQAALLTFGFEVIRDMMLYPIIMAWLQ